MPQIVVKYIMKVTLIILSALVLAFLAFQLYLYMSTNKVENRPYDVVKKAGNMEIRFYPSVRIAEIVSGTTSYEAMSSGGFRKLAGYIFGKNEKNESIAMTSPVEVNLGATESKMSFMMPSVYNAKELPAPQDSTVKITQTEDEHVAVISFSGFANDKLITQYSDKLAKMLKEQKLTPIGNYRYLGYNPPYQLIGRRNEVAVSVKWKM